MLPMVHAVSMGFTPMLPCPPHGFTIPSRIAARLRLTADLVVRAFNQTACQACITWNQAQALLQC